MFDSLLTPVMAVLKELGGVADMAAGLKFLALKLSHSDCDLHDRAPPRYVLILRGTNAGKLEWLSLGAGGSEIASNDRSK